MPQIWFPAYVFRAEKYAESTMFFLPLLHFLLKPEQAYQTLNKIDRDSHLKIPKSLV
jgi:hypothetical protein